MFCDKVKILCCCSFAIRIISDDYDQRIINFYQNVFDIPHAVIVDRKMIDNILESGFWNCVAVCEVMSNSSSVERLRHIAVSEVRLTSQRGQYDLTSFYGFKNWLWKGISKLLKYNWILFPFFAWFVQVPRPIVRDPKELMRLGLDCVYACKSDDQLSEALKIMDCMPKKGFGWVHKAIL